MTRYEAYITLYYALSNEAGKEDGLNENLNRFLERMNPFSSYSESSSDEDIYIRFCEKWDRVGSTVTSNSQNGGYTFCKVFIDTLPKRVKVFDDVKKSFLFIDQNDWNEALKLQAYSGTYELLFCLLSKHADKSNEKLIDYLAEMDPFSDKFQNEGSNVWNRFYAFVSDFGFDGPGYVTASKFVNSEKLDFLFDTFNEIKESEWDDLRFNYPYSFRMKNRNNF